MVILSTHLKEKIVKELIEFGINPDIFKHIYGNVKNKIEAIHSVLQENGFNPQETAYIGGTPHDIEAAKKENVISIAATYGYMTNEKLAHMTPDIYIKTIDDIIKVV